MAEEQNKSLITPDTKIENAEGAEVVESFKLTLKQEMFCKEYIIDFNGNQAAIRAGYSQKSARSMASQLLTNLNVQHYLKFLVSKREEKQERSGAEVIRRLWEVNDRTMQKISPWIDKKGRHVEIEDDSGKMCRAYLFDSKGATASAHLLGKHYGVISDKLDVNSEEKIIVQIEYSDKKTDAADHE